MWEISSPLISSIDEWEDAQRLKEEHSAYDFYFSGHPLDQYFVPLSKIGILTSSEAFERVIKQPLTCKICGQIQGIQERKSARGNKFAFIQMDDPSGGYEVTIFSQLLNQSRDFLIKGANIVASVEASTDGSQLKLLAKNIEPMENVIQKTPGLGLRVFIDNKTAAKNIKEQLDVSLQ